MARGIAGFYAAQAVIDFAVSIMLAVFAGRATMAVPWYRPSSGGVAWVLAAAGAVSLAAASRPRLQSSRFRRGLSLAQILLSAYPAGILLFALNDIYMELPPWWVLADPLVAWLLPWGTLVTGAVLGWFLTLPRAAVVRPPGDSPAAHR